VMETGYDILFFWVARMIMMGLEFTRQAPFHTVYLHGLVRDEHGRKMSKSYGNVIDPRTVMDEYGTDALRFTLLVGSTPGNDMNISVKKVEANRNFANKIWNAGRFVISAIAALTPGPSPEEGRGESALSSQPSLPISGEGRQGGEGWTLADSWIWARLQQLVRDAERLFQAYQYGEAGRQIYDFFWSDFADWYVEVAKLQMQNEECRVQTATTLARVLDMSLRLLHPFTPFVTEELWGHLRKALLGSPLADLAKDWPEALIVARWPEPRPEEGWETGALGDFALVQEIVRSIRNVRAEKKVKPTRRPPATVVGGAKTDMIEEQADVIAALAGLDQSLLSILESLKAKPEDSIALVAGAVEIHLPLSGMVDADEERQRLEKELSSAQVQIERLEKLLASDFASKAPAAVVQKERERLASFRETAEKLKAQL
jgi:valyl-tRNA synthetase